MNIHRKSESDENVRWQNGDLGSIGYCSEPHCWYLAELASNLGQSYPRVLVLGLKVMNLCTNIIVTFTQVRSLVDQNLISVSSPHCVWCKHLNLVFTIETQSHLSYCLSFQVWGYWMTSCFSPELTLCSEGETHSREVLHFATWVCQLGFVLVACCCSLIWLLSLSPP